jgi:ubiquitin C-terminal hydrolase
MISQSPMQNCLNDIQHRIYSVQEKICNLCSTDSKVYAFLIVGRILQAAALVCFAASIAFTFIVGPIVLIASIPAIALGILGTYVAGNPEELNAMLQMSRPFVPGQPVGLDNNGNNCWLNSSLQLLCNSPSFHRRLRQIPEFSQFLGAYAAARGNYQKVAKNVNTHAIRQFLSCETLGQITDGHTQEDAAQLFEYLFQGPNAPYQFDQQINGGASTLRREPMIQIDPGIMGPRPSVQQLFNHYFDYQSDIGQRVQLFFQNSPNDLLIQMKRFYQHIDPISRTLQQGKISDPIDVPERLAIPNHFVRSIESAEYICDGFAIHNGVNQDGGHYTSFIKVGTVWWYCSDTTVYEVSTRQALDAMKDGYIFHYSKVA